ncbi:hypothetical protein [Acetobacter sp.]|uniref:hypothetical protein n=1 Tax=Acetobacter sp. TaxID=440 RepID=UPI0039ECCF5A
METVRAQHIDTPQGRSLWREMLEACPGLRGVLDYVVRKQATPNITRLHWFQQELFERWFFRIPCPSVGRMIHSGDAWLGECGETIFRFPDAQNLLLVSAGRSNGYPISAVLLVTERMCLSFGARDTTLTAERTEHILSSLLDRPPAAPPTSIAAVIDEIDSIDLTSRILRMISEQRELRGPVSLWLPPSTFSAVEQTAPMSLHARMNRGTPSSERTFSGTVTFRVALPSCRSE